MNYVLNNQIVLSREPDGPIAVHLDAFSNSLNSRGYAPKYIHHQVRLDVKALRTLAVAWPRGVR